MENKGYKRILLKLSGEAISGGQDGIIDFAFLDRIAEVLKKCVVNGVQIAIIVGAGNIWRGAKGVGMDRCRADNMGMLATIINALGIESEFNRCGLSTVSMSAIEINEFIELYSAAKARKYMEEGNVVIIGGGTGDPYFTTDTAAALRAAELGVDAMMLAKNIDGVYDSDPKTNPNAKRYDKLTYKEMLDRRLHAIDLTAASFCMENGITSYLFALKNPEDIFRAVCGENVGTEIHN
ncbi:MAG: UMP kinase [Ruminococcaceae bacterium]|nr:UMP kinase [Oscillospiraceae bacterium]